MITMKKNILLTICLLISLFISSCNENKEVLTDQDILIMIYEATNGSNWSETQKENWLTEAPLADWKGVEVNEDGRVTKLQISGDSVRGVVPAAIGGLTELETLKIYMRNYGVNEANPFPSEINRLTKLKELGLSASSGRNEMKPVIPVIDALTNLEWIYLSGFNSEIPSYIGEFTNLRDIEILGFTCAVPEEITNLVNLERLFLRTASQPVGEFPAETGKLTKLKQLLVDYNTGIAGGITPPDAPFPESVWNLENMEHLFIRSASNRGEQIPPDKVAKMTNLRSITLSGCGITGTIPEEFFLHPKLYNFSIYNNELTGGIPAEIGNCPNLSTINLSKNQLTGPIPASLGNLEKLSNLQLDGNQLSPVIPTQVQKHPNFEKFKFE